MVQQQCAALLLQLAAAASCWTSAAASAVATSPGPPLPPLTKCCQWSTLEPGGSQKKCLGDGQHDGACPVGVGCECIAGWTPPSWAEEIASADRSLAGAADEPGATIGNGYVGAFVPRGVPGSAGPPYVGVEHVKGVFAAGGLLSQGHSSGTLGPNRQVSLALLASWTATAFVAELGGKPAVSTASTLDWRRAAYEVATPLPADDSSSYWGGGDRSHCVQSTYAHRQQPHLLITEFVCTNHNADASAAPLSVTIKQVIETPFCFQFTCENIMLPRQARDKRKKTHQKERRFTQRGWCPKGNLPPNLDNFSIYNVFCPKLNRSLFSGHGSNMGYARCGDVVFVPFHTKNWIYLPRQALDKRTKSRENGHASAGRTCPRSLTACRAATPQWAPARPPTRQIQRWASATRQCRRLA